MRIPGGPVVKNPSTNAGDKVDEGLISESGISPGGRHPVFLPGESYRQRSLAGYNP